MNNQQNKIRVTSLILLVQTVIWLVFTGVSMSQVESSWTSEDYVDWASDPDIFFMGNYINATLLTITAIMLFAFLYNYLKIKYGSYASIGFVFIPIYGVINIFCYSIQISVIPLIAINSLDSPDKIYFASQFIQANYTSFIGFMNGMSYAILGIPSIVYGILMFRELKKFSGIFISLNGVFCIIGIIGYIIENNILASGIMIGGILFMGGLVAMIFEFRSKILSQDY
ncbi:MAG: hypothetical protein ACFCUM_09920 [Bacteroidales bacterium]